MINTVVFDIGGVLIDWNPSYLYRKIFQSEDEIEYFLTEVCHPEWNAEQDAGNSLKEATEERIAKYPHLETQIRAYYDRWSEMLGGAIEPCVMILENLVANPDLKVLALSNWSQETFPVARRNFPFLRWFDGIVLSGEEKVKKPDPRLYQVLCDRFSVDPTGSIFIDDTYSNIITAREMGFKTIHLQEPKLLGQELSILLD